MNSIETAVEIDQRVRNDYAVKVQKMTRQYGKNYLDSIAPIVEEIRQLKKEKDVVILSHYYMSPLLQVLEAEGGVSDFVGDSLGLSLEATKVQAENIVFCGVSFMAQTAYIMNPGKNVFIPDPEAGCSLASSISAEDVKNLKLKYPGVPVMAYINTYAETKAESDVCCTSRNAMKIAASFDSDKIIFIPDKFMGRNLANSFKSEVNKEFILWNGSCEVHEQFLENIGELMDTYPAAEVLLHWEVPDSTVDSAMKNGQGIVGSTADLIRHVQEAKTNQFILASECDLGATMKGMFTGKQFITPCITCNYMKKIKIMNTLDVLRAIGTEDEGRYKITLDPSVRERAAIPIQKMIELS